MNGGISLITDIIDRQTTYFTANGRDRKCYVRLILDPFNHPLYGYETKYYTDGQYIYCLYSENEDLKEGDTIIYKADEYKINSRIVKANKQILVFLVNTITKES